MHPSVYEFVQQVLKPEMVRGKHVIEAGSRNHNGSIRPTIEALAPASYLGIDLTGGAGVDIVCAFEDYHPPRSYDLVVCTEVLEHVEHLHRFLHALKAAALVGGHILVTTRSPGFPIHGYPSDYWRYTQSDMRELFADCEILDLRDDWFVGHPGVFMLARRTGPVVSVTHLPSRIGG